MYTPYPETGTRRREDHLLLYRLFSEHDKSHKTGDCEADSYEREEDRGGLAHPTPGWEDRLVASGTGRTRCLDSYNYGYRKTPSWK
jgi:hypothetical protein